MSYTKLLFKPKTMNLRRVLQSLSLGLFLVFFGGNVEAQSQLAGVNQDGLIQLGSNHPFVVESYEMDISHLNLTNSASANIFFKKYLDEGLSLSYDLAAEKATLTFDLDMLSQYSGDAIPVATMNRKLKDVHRLRR
jgi:hypothetical protein